MPTMDLIQGHTSYRNLTGLTFQKHLIIEESGRESKKESVSTASWTDVVDITSKTHDFDFPGKGKLSIIFDERHNKTAAFFTNQEGITQKIK